MRHLTKTLLVAALLAGTGASQAAISTGADAEAFLQVYNSTTKITFDLDLGLTVSALATNINSLTIPAYDLSADSNWTSFLAAGAPTATNTKFGIVGAVSPYIVLTSTTAAGPSLNEGNFDASVTAINNQAGAINGADTVTAQNNSSLVPDTAAVGTGQWASSGGTATLKNLYGSFSAANAAISYGATGKFFSLTDDSVNQITNIAQLGTWALAGSTLTFTNVAPPAAVPLPAAVWLFGAGLMTVLGVNRRKVAA